MTREQQLINAFVELADTLVEQFDPDELLHRMVELCIEILQADAAGVLVQDQEGQLRAVTATSREMHQLEVFEVAVSEGPSYQAAQTGRNVIVDDLGDRDDEWPRLAAQARNLGFEACYGFPLRWYGETFGALNLFLTAEQAPLRDTDQAAARGFADVATISLLQDRRNAAFTQRSEQLQTALDNRVIIEQAKGTLAERHGLGQRESFERLRRYCRSNNIAIRDVAQEIVDGRLDPVLPGLEQSQDSAS